jgi:hypothetical protein
MVSGAQEALSAFRAQCVNARASETGGIGQPKSSAARAPSPQALRNNCPQLKPITLEEDSLHSVRQPFGVEFPQPLALPDPYHDDCRPNGLLA